MTAMRSDAINGVYNGETYASFEMRGLAAEARGGVTQNRRPQTSTPSFAVHRIGALDLETPPLWRASS